MKSYSLAELHMIMSTCASANVTNGPQELLDWMRSKGIEPEVWVELVDQTIVQGMALFMAVPKEMSDVLGAIYSAGFEFGVRFQETLEKEVEI
jgi:hypothetical protein